MQSRGRAGQGFEDNGPKVNTMGSPGPPVLRLWGHIAKVPLLVWV